jgi:hypothetical protein
VLGKVSAERPIVMGFQDAREFVPTLRSNGKGSPKEGAADIIIKIYPHYIPAR